MASKADRNLSPFIPALLQLRFEEAKRLLEAAQPVPTCPLKAGCSSFQAEREIKFTRALSNEKFPTPNGTVPDQVLWSS